MRVYALSDPHLALATPNKAMDRFGPQWVDHATTMARNWDAQVGDDDLVLVPGDVSWARDFEQVAADLAWLAERPGTKVVGKGNHEHWWKSRAKVRAILPEGVLALDGDALRLGDVALAGSRLWDSPDSASWWHDLIVWQGEPISPETSPEAEAAALKVYTRELGRLERSLAQLDTSAPVRIAMLHYPPAGPGLAPTEATALLEAHGVQHCVYGHLHAIDLARVDQTGGEARGVRYLCASCDLVDFTPALVCEV
jgi:hypothetical protein